MIKATARMKDGRVALVLGLSDLNLRRLKAGQPIYFDMATVKMALTDQLGSIAIFYGKDEAILETAFRDNIRPGTEVIVVPPPDPHSH